MLQLLLSLLILLPPKPAAYVAAVLVGKPTIGADLARVCRRESRCMAVGVHAADAIPERSSYWGQIKLGDRARLQGKDTHLDRSCQPAKGWKRWGTRGAFGLNAADAWPYLWRCYTPEVLDVPIISAVVAAQLYANKCMGSKDSRISWCPKH